MNHIVTIACFFQFFLVSVTYGGSCTPINLKSPGKCYSQMKTLNQDGVGHCYAHAASGMADCSLHNQNPQSFKQSSPLAAGIHLSQDQAAGNSSMSFMEKMGRSFLSVFTKNINTADDRKKGNIEGDFVCSAFDAIKKRGTCPQSDMFRAFQKFGSQKKFLASLGARQTGDPAQGFAGTNNNETESVNKCTSLKGDSKGYNISKFFSKVGDVVKGFYKSIFGVNNKRDKKNMANAKKRYGIKSTPKYGNNTIDHVAKEVAKICNGKLRQLPEDAECEKKMLPSKDYVNDIFDENPNRPVGISYCSSLLTQPNDGSSGSSFFGRASNLAKKNLNGSCNPHASVLIGRKKINGKCHFLLRNSWGTGCKKYKISKIDCDAKSGDLWVDADRLMNNVMEAEHITK
jgi:hypothetical protein